MVRHHQLLLFGLPALAGTDSAAPTRRHAGCDGELTFNGICLPPTWPPRINLTHRATAPPYLAAPPAVIDITIGRQLFVDDFLVDGARSSGLQRHWPQPRLQCGLSPPPPPPHPHPGHHNTAGPRLWARLTP